MSNEPDATNPIDLTKPQIDLGQLGHNENYSAIDISISLKKQTPEQEASEIRLKEAEARLNRNLRGASYVIAVVVLIGCIVVYFLPNASDEAREAVKDIGLLIVGGLIGVAFPKVDKPEEPKGK